MLAEIKNLNITFPSSGGSEISAVKALNLHIRRAETLALVGESGSGKSLTALSLMRLLPKSAQVTGEISFEGERLDKRTDREMRSIRGARIAMIFQEPMTALNPLHNIGKQISEIIQLHRPISSKIELERRVKELLTEVGLQKLSDRLGAYPHQLSGGERQRIVIAMAIACEPELLLADEPTTAVDVTLQVQILKLLQKLQRDRGLSILFITHDLKIVEKIADRVAVLRGGELLEVATKSEFFASPSHSYSKMLLESRPSGKPVDVAGPSREESLLIAENVMVRFPRKKNFLGRVKEWNVAVNSGSFKVRHGISLGVVGESGSGKTTLAMALLRLQKSTGEIVFLGRNISEISSHAKMRNIRSDMQIVFQDPFASLNPRLTVSEIVGEGLRVHSPNIPYKDRRARVSKLLCELGLSESMLDRYPHEFSGGQRQRISIARAMILRPKLVVMDEPTSALDVTVQAQIIDLLRDLQKNLGITIIFISHDLQVVRAICHEVLVMRQGNIVEIGPVEQIFESPKEEYTKRLIKASMGEDDE